jgi:hypothetical protein
MKMPAPKMRAAERSYWHGLLAAALLCAACGEDSTPPTSIPNDAAESPAADASEPGDASAPSDAGDGADAAADAATLPDAASWEPPAVDLPDPESSTEFWLSQTGLYRDIADKMLAPDLRPFEPTYKLWSDGADKQRWLRLPEGSRIDSSDMEHWQFPVGTLFWKEFSHAGKRLETRLIARTGPGRNDYWMGAFVWLDDESDARFVPDGENDVRETEHDVPTVKNCGTCHNGEAGRILGFSAVQQPEAPSELLSDPPAAPFRAPGDARTAAALGYLHANCAHCHNPNGSARPDTDMHLRLQTTDREPEDTFIYRSTVGVPLQYFESEPFSLRVAPGDPDQSGLLFRMTQRGEKTQMPPLATEQRDDDGIAAVRAWIETLP